MKRTLTQDTCILPARFHHTQAYLRNLAIGLGPAVAELHSSFEFTTEVAESDSLFSVIDLWRELI